MKSHEQVDLCYLADIAIEIFKNTCILGRASRSHCETLRNSEIDCNLACATTKESWLKVCRLVDIIEMGSVRASPGDSNRHFEYVHGRNLTKGGYFASHPIDAFTKSAPRESFIEFQRRANKMEQN